MKNSLKESFKKVCEDDRLIITKDHLINLAYEKDHSGIDYAIPQAWVNENPHENLFYFVTDCTTGFFEVKNLLDLIPDSIAEKVIKRMELATFLSGKNYVNYPEYLDYKKLSDELYNLMY